MPTSAEWQDLIAAKTAPVRPTARTLLAEREGSWTLPARVRASDGADYLIKFPQTGRPEVARTLITEQVVGHLATLLGVPAPTIAQVDIEALREIEDRLADAAGSVAHGSLLIENVTDGLSYEYADEPVNRGRFGAITVLYSWVETDDYQYMYSKVKPRSVFCFDQGECLPGGRGWTVQSLVNAPPAVVNPLVREFGRVSAAHMQDTINRLQAVSPDEIADTVALPPDEWGISPEERVALAEFLFRRAAETVEAVAAIL